MYNSWCNDYTKGLQCNPFIPCMYHVSCLIPPRIVWLCVWGEIGPLPPLSPAPLTHLVNWIAQSGNAVGNVLKPEKVSASEATSRLIRVSRCR